MSPSILLFTYDLGVGKTDAFVHFPSMLSLKLSILFDMLWFKYVTSTMSNKLRVIISNLSEFIFIGKIKFLQLPCSLPGHKWWWVWNCAIPYSLKINYQSRWSFNEMKETIGLRVSNPNIWLYWNHFEMRLLNMRINLFRIGMMSLVTVSLITEDTVTRFIIPIRSRGKSPEEGQRRNLAET